MEGFPTLKGSWPWPWSGHTAYHCVSVIDLYLHAKFHWNQQNYLWTDGRTYTQTDGHLRPTLLGRLKRVDLKIQQQLQPNSVCIQYFENDTKRFIITMNNIYMGIRMPIKHKFW